MKRLTVILMALALLLMGATLVLAQALPQVLNGVNLNPAQAVTPAQAQQVRGAAGTTATIGLSGLINAVSSSSSSIPSSLYYSGAPPLRSIKPVPGPSPSPVPRPAPIKSPVPVSPSPVPRPAPVKSMG